MKNKARVGSQILPGAPVWKLRDPSRFPDFAYIEFPGKVGDETAVVEVVHQLTP